MLTNPPAVISISRNRSFLLLFFVCCSLPFIAAKLALSFAWFPAGVTNKGQWLERDVQLLKTSNNAQEHWHLVYVQAQECDALCELSLYGLQQIYSGLGRQQNQISAVIIAANSPPQLSRFPALKWQSPSTSLSGFQNHVFIVNQDGLALLRYPVINDKQSLLVIAKDIRTDLRRLMNYDRSSL
jgi:hypothetical protein